VEAGDRSNHLERVAMQDDHVCIRVGREQGTQSGQMGRRFQDPPLAGATPLQVLEELPVVPIRRPEVLLFQPRLVRRDEPSR